MRTFIIIFIGLITHCTIAQVPKWDYIKHAGSADDEIGWGVIFNNSVKIVGMYNNIPYFDSYSLPYSGYYSSIFYCSLDSYGNYENIKAFSTYTTLWTGYATIYNITQIKNSLYCVGWYKDSTLFDTNYTSYGLGGNDAFFCKLNQSGDIQWLKTANGTNEEYFIQIHSFMNNDLIIAGQFYQNIILDSTELTSQTTGKPNIVLTRVDTNGNYIWVKHLAKGGGGTIYGLCADNNYIYMTGFFNNTTIFGDTSLVASSGNASDIYVCKINENGDVVWARKAGGNSQYSEVGRSITTDKNGNIFLFGQYGNGAVFGSQTLYTSSYGDNFLAKIDSMGNFLWVKPFNLPNYQYSASYYNNSIVCDSLGNVYVTGWYKDSMNYDGTSLYAQGTDNYNSYVMKANNNGDLIWLAPISCSDLIFSQSLAIDENNNLYITGNFWGTAWFGEQSITSYGASDVFIAKLHEEPVSVGELGFENSGFKIYPNPNNGSFYFDMYGKGNVELEIYDISGRKVDYYKFDENCRHAFINNDMLEQGTYSYILFNNNIPVLNGKLIIVK